MSFAIWFKQTACIHDQYRKVVVSRTLDPSPDQTGPNPETFVVCANCGRVLMDADIYSWAEKHFGVKR
jgi:hypothetical protein